MNGLTGNMERPLRTVLIGLGQIGASYAEDPRTRKYFEYSTHAQVLETHPEFEWIAACDLSATAREAAQLRWPNLRIERDIIPLRQLDPEVVVLATGPKGRLEIIRQLPGVRGVICEKPLGVNANEALAFAAACHDQQLPVQVNLWRRAERAMRSLAAGDLSRRIGEPQSVFSVYGRGLRNNGSHLIDTCRMLFGEAEYLQATSPLKQVDSPGVQEDYDVAFSMRFANGLIASFHPIAFTSCRENSIEIWGTAGCYTIRQEGLAHRLAPRTAHRALTDAYEIDFDAVQHLVHASGRSIYDMYTNLAATIHGRESLWSPVENALRTQDLVEAVIESAREGGTRMELERCRILPRRRAS